MIGGVYPSLHRVAADVKVYDISVPLDEELAVYPGDTMFSRDIIMAFEKGDECALTGITMSAHFGTHLDSPAHFFPDGRTIDSYPPEQFILPAQVVESASADVIRAEELRELTLSPGTALLFKTSNSLSGLVRKKAFAENYVCLSEKAAYVCAQLEPSLVGIDYFSIDSFSDKKYPAHFQLLGAGILVLEGIDLREVPVGKYTLCCFPLRLRGLEASPVRAVLFASETV